MSRWTDITPQGLAALRVIVASPGPIGRAAVASQTGLSKSNISKIVDRLVARGHVTEVPRPVEHAGRAPLLVATDAGRAAVPCGDIAPAVAEELPAVVHLASRVVALVTFLRAEAAAGRVPSQAAMGNHLGCHRANVQPYLAAAARAGCVEWTDGPRALRTRARLTPLGVAVAEGCVRVEEPVRRVVRPVVKRRPVAAVRAAVVRVAAKVAQAVVREEPVVDQVPVPRAAPVDVGPPVPPGLDVNAPRPVRHPAPPAPAARPAHIRPGDWRRWTSAPRSPLHDACARGTA